MLSIHIAVKTTEKVSEPAYGRPMLIARCTYMLLTTIDCLSSTTTVFPR